MSRVLSMPRTRCLEWTRTMVVLGAVGWTRLWCGCMGKGNGGTVGGAG